MLAADVEAVLFVRFPQFPSSRAWGNAPAVSLAEYRSMMPRDPALAKIVPVPPRPFPDALRNGDSLPPPLRPSDIAAAAWGVVSILGIPWVLRALWRRLQRARPRRAT
jgi:hypothetical protein